MQRPWLRNDTDTVNHGGTGQPNSLNHGYEQSAHLGVGPYPDRARQSRNNIHTTDDAGVGERLERCEPVHRAVPRPPSRSVQLERVDSPQPGERRSGRAGSPIGPLHRSDSALGAFLRRKKAHLGAPKAITATAHKLARLIYTMLRYGQEYVDAGAEHYERQYQQRALRAAKRRAAQLGYQLVPISDAGDRTTYAPPGAPIAA